LRSIIHNVVLFAVTCECMLTSVLLSWLIICLIIVLRC